MHSGLYFAHSTLLRCMPALLTGGRKIINDRFQFWIEHKAPNSTFTFTCFPFTSQDKCNPNPSDQATQSDAIFMNQLLSNQLYVTQTILMNLQAPSAYVDNMEHNLKKKFKNLKLKLKHIKQHRKEISRKINLSIADLLEPRRNLSDWSINSVRKKLPSIKNFPPRYDTNYI